MNLGSLLDHLQLEAATLVGHSQGARVALAFSAASAGARPGARAGRSADEIGDAAAAGDEDFSIAESADGSRSRVSMRSARLGRHPLMRPPLPGLGGARARRARVLDRYRHMTSGRHRCVPRRRRCRRALRPAHETGAGRQGEFDTLVRRRAGEALANALPLAERVVCQRRDLPNLDAPLRYNDAVQAS